jgi:hypothetical protein
MDFRLEQGPEHDSFLSSQPTKVGPGAVWNA